MDSAEAGTGGSGACRRASCDIVTLFGDILRAVRIGDLVDNGDRAVLGSCTTLTSVFATGTALLVRLPFQAPALGASLNAQGGGAASKDGAPGRPA